MSSRFACKHETWARQFCSPRKTGGPLVMGVTPGCPWCAREGGQKMVSEMARNATAENADLRAEVARLRAALEEAARFADDEPNLTDEPPVGFGVVRR